MIRNMSRRFIESVKAMMMLAAARDDNNYVTSTVSGDTGIDVQYVPGVYGPLNPHGCPWPGSRAACARRTAGKTRRMR